MLNYSDEALLWQVGGNIRALRKKRKMSLKDLAYKIGMEPSNLSVIENGRSNPQLLTYAKIASALNSSLREICSIEFDYGAFAESEPTYKPRKHHFLLLLRLENIFWQNTIHSIDQGLF